MERNNQSQFTDLSNRIEIELQKGSIHFQNQIRNCNTLDKKKSSISALNLKDDSEYFLIIHGIINGMLYDENMNLENYFQFLFTVNRDSYKTFLITLRDVISFGKLKKEKFDKIYQIFEKLIKVNFEKYFLVEILVSICRQFYPGQELLNYIIYSEPNNNDNDADNFIKNNIFYKFLNFIKNNLEFIFENDKEVNVPGIIFIKIIRLLTETHIYHNLYNLTSNENINEKNSEIINTIISAYQKINFSEKNKKLIAEIYDIEIYILTKIYEEKKQNVYDIGRELIRHLISIGNSNIEIINTIIEDLKQNSNYEKILYLSNYKNGTNIYTMINIPHLMENMLTFILTSITKNSVTYPYYINWLFREYQIENSIGYTLIVDITRYIMTNNYYYFKYQYVQDYVPRWLILCYFLRKIKNHILSSEIKQTIFLDLILFDKNKDNYYLIEPSLTCIISNLKEFPEISEELIEYLEHYVKHFDDLNVQRRINCICDAFYIFEQRGRNCNDFDKLILNSNMEDKFKNSLLNLIKNENWIKENKINNNNINNNIPNNNIINNNEDKNNNIDNNNKMNKEINIPKDNININNNKNNEINNNSNININNEKNKELQKKKNIEILIPKEMNTYVSAQILKNIILERNQRNFHLFLNELYKYNLNNYGKINNNIKNLDITYKNLCLNFAKFYIKIFKDELELKAFENYSTYNNYNLYLFLFDYAYEKLDDNNVFSFIADLINKTIEIYPLLILLLMKYILIKNNNYNNQKHKKNYNYITFFYQLDNSDIELIKQKLNLFFVQCEENFLNEPLRFFFLNNGVEIFSNIFLDDEHLILKIIRNCDMLCINKLNISLNSNRYILIDKKFFILFRYSILFSALEKNIFWNIIYSQGYIPSVNLEQFLLSSIDLLQNPPNIKEEIIFNYDEFFWNIINSIKIVFKKEIFLDINKNDLDSLSQKFSHIFEFYLGLKMYIFILVDIILEHYFFSRKERKKIFYLIMEKYYRNNNKNIQNLRIMLEYVHYFAGECKKKYIGDKSENSWINEDTKNLINEITNMINNYNNAEMNK